MELSDHLLYIDITNECNLDCEFCMYKKERANGVKKLILDEKSKANLIRLINYDKTSLVTISGEGETFNNPRTIDELLRLMPNRSAQIVTNGNWNRGELKSRLLSLASLAYLMDSNYTLRISMDADHLKRIGREKYGDFFENYSHEPQLKTLGLAIRSIIEDRPTVIKTVSELLMERKVEYELDQLSPLDDVILLGGGRSIKISYQNLIKPPETGRTSNYSIYDYISALEKKYGKTFTMGNLSAKGAEKGLDLTVKPDGSIFFYGAEVQAFGNIFLDDLDMPYFEKIAQENQVINRLYTRPFVETIQALSMYPIIKNKIEEVNNPYWVIRTLYPSHKKEINEALKIK